MIADDEKVQREGIAKHVPWHELGMEVIGCAADGSEALEGIRLWNPQLLITDVKMPKMNGLDLSREAKVLNKKIKILFVSGFDEFEYARKAIEVNASAYLLKPIQLTKLRHELIKIRQECLDEQQTEQGRLIYHQYWKEDSHKGITFDNMKNTAIVQTILQTLEQHYHEQISIEDLARKVHLTPNYISHIFKECVGDTIINHLTTIRMSHARILLADLSNKIYEVAEKTGYNSTSYFSVVFKNTFGVSPKEYRERLFIP